MVSIVNSIFYFILFFKKIVFIFFACNVNQPQGFSQLSALSDSILQCNDLPSDEETHRFRMPVLHDQQSMDDDNDLCIQNAPISQEGCVLCIFYCSCLFGLTLFQNASGLNAQIPSPTGHLVPEESPSLELPPVLRANLPAEFSAPVTYSDDRFSRESVCCSNFFDYTHHTFP
jgi:hypothetical protein